MKIMITIEDASEIVKDYVVKMLYGPPGKTFDVIREYDGYVITVSDIGTGVKND